MKHIGPYNIIKKIASGGMATVYLATHNDTNVKVAIKLLKEELQDKEKITDRLTQEGLLKLNHPNIVKTLAVGTHNNTPYIVMEYIEGSDLEEIIKKQGRLSIDKSVNIFKQILSALSYVHSKGIIHRDIKPKNILIDKEGKVKLTDFGIAKSLYSHIKTSTGGYLGAPAYSSPEQMDGKKVDSRSDIYSLGITLYEMLTGAIPYSSTSIDIIIKEKFLNQIIPIKKRRKDIPSGIVSIVNKCITKDPSDRFSSVGELQNLLKDKPSVSKTIIRSSEPHKVFNATLLLKKKSSDMKKVWIAIGVMVSFIIVISIIIGFAGRENREVDNYREEEAVGVVEEAVEEMIEEEVVEEVIEEEDVGARAVKEEVLEGKIAFTSYYDGDGEICIMDYNSDSISQLTDNESMDWDPCFSPDGSRIAFYSRSPGNKIYIINSDGSDIMQFTDDSSSCSQPAWSPDGSKIAFSSQIYGHTGD